MPAIITKYIGPSNVRGSRVKAYVENKSVTLGWDDALDSDANHLQAARELADKLEWDYDGEFLHSMSLPKGKGARVHAFVRS